MFDWLSRSINSMGYIFVMSSVVLCNMAPGIFQECSRMWCFIHQVEHLNFLSLASGGACINNFLVNMATFNLHLHNSAWLAAGHWFVPSNAGLVTFCVHSTFIMVTNIDRVESGINTKFQSKLPMKHAPVESPELSLNVAVGAGECSFSFCLMKDSSRKMLILCVQMEYDQYKTSYITMT